MRKVVQLPEADLLRGGEGMASREQYAGCAAVKQGKQAEARQLLIGHERQRGVDAMFPQRRPQLGIVQLNDVDVDVRIASAERCKNLCYVWRIDHEWSSTDLELVRISVVGCASTCHGRT